MQSEGGTRIDVERRVGEKGEDGGYRVIPFL